MDPLQTSVHSDAEAIPTYFISKKMRKVSGTSYFESNWVGYPVEDNTKGEGHESFYVSGDILKISLQTRELLGN